MHACLPGDTERGGGANSTLSKISLKEFYPKLRDTASCQPPATGKDHKIIDEFGG